LPEGARGIDLTGALATDLELDREQDVIRVGPDDPLDLTGLEEPYVPPAGLRSGAALAAFSEEEMLGRFYGFI